MRNYGYRKGSKIKIQTMTIFLQLNILLLTFCYLIFNLSKFLFSILNTLYIVYNKAFNSLYIFGTYSYRYSLTSYRSRSRYEFMKPVEGKDFITFTGTYIKYTPTEYIMLILNSFINFIISYLFMVLDNIIFYLLGTWNHFIVLLRNKQLYFVVLLILNYLWLKFIGVHNYSKHISEEIEFVIFRDKILNAIFLFISTLIMISIKFNIIKI